jgi:predicted histidine transporter YuiF (NhaC family)
VLNFSPGNLNLNDFTDFPRAIFVTIIPQVCIFITSLLHFYKTRRHQSSREIKSEKNAFSSGQRAEKQQQKLLINIFVIAVAQVFCAKSL